MNFYIFIKVKNGGGGGGGGCTSACICMGTHSQPLLQNRWMDIYQTWRYKVLMHPHNCIDFWAKSVQGWIQVGA